ncbi:HD-GYP domain-containing protein [Alkalibacter saccharofermentans]|uniref:HDIG domain-containing protein n=1 Tax=Alkalibacter saccharofermentans DSM 14828 TaxID=1120975 RepID=A0A1M4VDJ3_9FIRM|nr:HD-GYP domain-containing protein [Alkalibacter saccharofermentans]SHE67084.1 HDIG domain-containing protein [Alkalibacter saccharofermentans DSM 14828]
MGSTITRETKFFLIKLSLTAVLLSIYIVKFYSFSPDLDFLIFVTLTIIAESLVIFTPRKGGVTLGFGVILPVSVIYGPYGAIISAALGTMLAVYKMDNKYKHILNIELYKTVGNTANYVISAGLSSIVYFTLNSGTGISAILNSILIMLITSVVFIASNMTITGMFIIKLTDFEPREVWKENFSGLVPNVLGVSAISIIITMAYLNFGIESIIILFFPYLLIRYSFQLVFDMRQSYLNTIKALSSALEEKDPYTKGHSERVEKYSAMLAKESGAKIDLQQLQYAAIFHDIGKIGILDTILNKPGKLTVEEFEFIKEHPSKGVHILENVTFLKKATEIIGAHHEYLDGTGYPRGLVGEEIPYESKIITVVDIFDAVTTDRPYRPAMSHEEAIEILKNESGKKLDPYLVEKFIKLHDEGRLIQ